MSSPAQEAREETAELVNQPAVETRAVRLARTGAPR